jgi:hypothetical protein
MAPSPRPSPLEGEGVVWLRACAGLNAGVRWIAGKPAPTGAVPDAGVLAIGGASLWCVIAAKAEGAWIQG